MDCLRRRLGWGMLAILAAPAAGADAPTTGPASSGETRIHPGKVRLRATWSCMGIELPFTGDANRSATVGVEFRRKGEKAWRPATPLWLHRYGKTTMFAGSVVRLAAGTDYEFRLSIADDDGDGVYKTVATAAGRTLDYPRLPAKVADVPPGGGLVKAQELAEAGTVMRLGAGTLPGTLLKKSGKPGEWIVYQGAAGGKTVINSRVEVRADYVWLDGLTIADPKNAVQGSHKGVCITRCRITSHYAIHTGRGCENYFIADNVLVGDAKGRFTFGGEGVDFGSDRGNCGNAVCFNEMTDFADGVSYGRGDIDVHNNYIHETVDDFIEPDYARANYRLWNNRCYNSMCGFSFQPMKGGPWYIFDNINVGAYLHCLKVKDVTGANVIANNTFMTKSSRIGHGFEIVRGWLLNNAWMRATPGTLADRSYGYNPRHNPTRLDYNAYGTGGQPPWSKRAYDALAKKNGWDRHSIYVDYKSLFLDEIKVPTGTPFYGRGVHGRFIGPDWHFNHALYRPKPDAKIVDAGVVLPNITGPYLGASRDIGAQEAGLGTAWYGPRTWDAEAGLIYGLPAGWKKLPSGRSAAATAMGCPKVVSSLLCLLVRESPGAFALLWQDPAAGPARWARARQIVADARGATTKVLEFQDGLYMRLYEKGDNARLVVARVEPAGVLHAVIGCRKKDLPALRTEMFQLARSLYR